MFVVAGASGFIGCAVVAALVRRGVPVLAASRQSLACKRPEQCILVKSYADLKPPTADSVLVHLAEPRDIATVDAKGETYVAERRAALAAMLAHNWSFVVYASSAAVYGDESQLPHRADEKIDARGSYARAKAACERDVLVGDGAVARIANVYGPGMAPNNVLADILRQIPADGPLTLRDTKTVRDYLWIDDLAEGLATLAIARKLGIFNFGTGRGLSAGELARLALDRAGERARPIRASAEAKRASHLVLDIAATTAALGWTPQVSVERGVSMLLGAAR